MATICSNSCKCLSIKGNDVLENRRLINLLTNRHYGTNRDKLGHGNGLYLVTDPRKCLIHSIQHSTENPCVPSSILGGATLQRVIKLTFDWSYKDCWDITIRKSLRAIRRIRSTKLAIELDCHLLKLSTQFIVSF